MKPLLQKIAANGISALDELSEAIALVEPAGETGTMTVAWANAAFTHLTQYERHEIETQPIWLLVGADSNATGLVDLRDALFTAQPFVGALETQRKDGALIALEWSVSPVRDGSGRVLVYVCIFRARQTAGEQVAAAAARFRAALDGSHEGLYVCAPLRKGGEVIDFRFTYVNAAAAAHSNSTPTRLVAESSLISLIPEFATNGFFAELVGLLEGEAMAQADVRVARGPAQQTCLHYIARRLCDEVAITVRDESELHTLQAMLRHSQKLESVGRLAAGIAHDLNNFLSSIIGFGGFMRESLSNTDPLQKDLEEVLSNAQRASNLTRQLLAIGRQQLLTPQIMDGFATVLNLTGMLRRLLGEGIELHTRRRCGPALIKANPGQVEQVLLNLAINARDAMGAHGTLTIECDAVQVSPEEARHRTGTFAGSFVKFSVRDTGHGMPPEVMNRIFEPFYTTKAPGKGTGLGLAVVIGIVRQSGGFVKVHSEPGAGSTFDVYLPLCEDPHPDVSPLPPASYAGLQGSELVLVVEDDESVRSFLTRLLAKNGYGVLEAEDGLHALEVAKRSEHIALLLADVMMARMDGVSLAKELRISFPDMKVVFISGYGSDGTFDPRLREAAEPFVAKPLDAHALLVTLRRVLEGHTLKR